MFCAMSVVVEGGKAKPVGASKTAEPNALISLRAKKESTLRQKLESSDKVEKSKGVELTT